MCTDVHVSFAVFCASVCITAYVGCQGENYNYRDALILSHYEVEEVPAKEKDRVCL